ncbi:LamG-like jellyroll fold domain-containing protein, partial [Thiogranum longum]|uniref:LamG-like jellyroll fold domain-containing protein n=1 Tax=Thiogranum longum TaxID=1537524 RepID=UPI001403490B
DNANPSEGGTIIYTVTATNNGPLDATGVVLSDVLPAGLTYVSDDSGGAYDSGTGAWSVGSLPNGNLATLNITATVNTGTAGSTLTNTASVSALNEPDPVAGNDSASVSLTVVSGTNLPPALDPIPNQVVTEGQLLTFNISASDPDATIPLLSATNLPATATFQDNLDETGTFTWTPAAGDAAGSPYSVTFTATDAVEPLLTDTRTISITVQAASGGSGAFQQDSGAGGVVSMEAENNAANLVAPDGHAWVSAGGSFPGFAGTDALQALPEDGVRNGTGYSTLSPQLDFQVNFVATGTHYLWVRGLAPSTGSDSFHAGLDGLETGSAKNLRGSGLGSYIWVNTKANGARTTLDIATVGEHTVNVWMAESGFVVDKIVLTTDAAFDPSTINGGLGPDESGQSGQVTVDTPVINPNGGSFSGSMLITLSTSTSGATIYYTLDGSDPTTSSSEYLGPFSLSTSATLKVRAFLSGSNPSAVASAVFMNEPMPTGLRRYWPLDETGSTSFADITGGAAASCTACPAPATGQVAGAQQFDGIANEINVADDGSFDWATTDRFSVEAWVNKSLACVGTEVIVGRHDASSQLHWWLGCDNGMAAFRLVDSGGAGVGVNLVGTTDITDGQWHHLAAVRDAISGEIRLYVDSTEEASAVVNYPAGFAGTTDLNIGWLNDPAFDYHFAGTIDEVALYDRVLPPAQISRHYQDGTIGLRRGYWGCGSPITIMPLGDSITRRQGYRPQLYFDLLGAGYDIDFVGSKVDTSGTHDRDHEGHSGFTTSDIAASLSGWLALNPPEVILLHIGTNEDPSFPYPSPTGVEDLLNIVDTFDSNTSVVLSRIINKVPNQPLVTQFNDNVVAMAQTRISGGDRIVVVDHENALNYVDDMDPDGIHPNAAGFTKMVPVWSGGLASFLPACIAVTPQVTSSPVTTATVGVPYTYTVAVQGFPAPTFSLLTAPAGMTVHPDTGVISWAPGAVGAENVSVQVQNLQGTITHDFTVNVN